MNGKWSRSEAKSGSFRWYSRVRESTAVYGRSTILYEKALPLFSLLFFYDPVSNRKNYNNRAHNTI